jgi:hypothetical protein
LKSDFTIDAEGGADSPPIALDNAKAEQAKKKYNTPLKTAVRFRVPAVEGQENTLDFTARLYVICRPDATGFLGVRTPAR